MQRFAVIVPALDPEDKLLDLLDALRAGEPSVSLVVVDDGSGPAAESVFEAIRQRGDVTLLCHPVNRGKGAALKTAFRYGLDHLTDCAGFVTADCDGQHAPGDILAVVSALAAHPASLVLGVRDFTAGGVPFRSRLGNCLSCLTFRLASLRVSDTQTGLRGIPRACLPALLAIPHDRYEFETAMLIAARRAGLSFLERPIATLYLNRNQGSHFSPLRDSARIYRVLFRNTTSQMKRFLLTALTSAGLDLFLFWLLFHWILPAAGLPRLFWATVIARVCSACGNYLMNRNYVFRHRTGAWDRQSLAHYAFLCAWLACASYLSMRLLLPHVRQQQAVLLKAGLDAGLFLVSFTIQKCMVFSRTRPCTDEAAGKAVVS